ncbi:unnamed protein product [Malus baccata var. baccata]
MSVILCNKNILKPSFGVGHGKPTTHLTPHSLPLFNSLAGDFGFDPLGLGEDGNLLGCMCRQSWFMLALQCLEYPRGLLLKPLGLVKEIKNAHEWKLKRLRTRDPNMTRADFASRWYDAPNTSKRE